MELTTLALQGLLFVVLLGAVNLVFAGEVALGAVAGVAAVSLYWHLRRAARRAE